jgi:hypothetical protein
VSEAHQPARGLHPGAGFLVAWGYVLVGWLIPPLVLLQLGFTTASTINSEFHGYPANLWWPWSLAGAVIVLAAGYYGIRTSARLGTILGISEIAVLEVFTEDCFGGRVRSEQDLVSQVCEFPFLNPQTGPLYLEVPSRGTRSRCTSFPSSRPGPGRRPRHGTGRERTIVSGRSKGRPPGRNDIRQRAAIWPPPSSFSWPSSVGTERPDLDDHVS